MQAKQLLRRVKWSLSTVTFAAVLTGCGGGEEPDPDEPDGDSIPLDCEADGDCDDDNACNGREVCGDDGTCESGEPLDCDDGVECTEDSCDQDSGECVHQGPDEDSDGFIDASCEDAGGESLGDDCDDNAVGVHPNATEVCDEAGVDEDCDPNTIGHKDEDGDGAVSDECFNEDASGSVFRGTDCDDENLAVRKGQPEFCDAIDNDCDGEVDEDTGAVRWYADKDGDGFGGVDAPSRMACIPPAGYSLLNTDCHDDAIAQHPAQIELCDDEIDNNCTGYYDEGPTCDPSEGTKVTTPPPVVDYTGIPQCSHSEHCDDGLDCTDDTCNQNQKCVFTVTGDFHIADDLCVAGPAIDTSCRGIDAAFFQSEADGSPLHEGIVVDGTLYQRQATDPHGRTFPTTWSKEDLAQSLHAYGPQPRMGEQFAMDVHRVPGDNAFERTIFSGLDVFEMDSIVQNGEFWATQFVDSTIEDRFTHATADALESGVDAFWVRPVYLANGDIDYWERRAFVGNTTYFSFGGADGTIYGTWSSSSLDDFWGTGTDEPPTDKIDAAAVREVLSAAGVRLRMRQIIYRGTGRFTRDSTNPEGTTWPDAWEVEPISNYWGGDSNAPPIDCSPAVYSVCPPDPDNHLGGASTCLTEPIAYTYIPFDLSEMRLYGPDWFHYQLDVERGFSYQQVKFNGIDYATAGETFPSAGKVHEALTLESDEALLGPNLWGAPVAISMWVKLDSAPQTEAVFYRPWSCQTYALSVTPGLKLKLRLASVFVGCSSYDQVVEVETDAVAFVVGEWVHIAMNFGPENPPSVQSQAQLFVNGLPMNLRLSGAPPSTPTDVVTIPFNTLPEYWDNTLIGDVDAMFDEILTLRPNGTLRVAPEDLYRAYLYGRAGMALPYVIPRP